MENDILSNVWPEWHTVKRLGSGSFGVVYEAIRQDNSVESHAAIKVISIPPNESEIDSIRSEGLSEEATKTYLQNFVNDFVNEIQIMESFKGTQNIVSVEDYKVVERTDEIGWDIYIRMELLTPLTHYISDKSLSEQDVIKLGIDICSALELCEKRNVIHRDIKPENIFINQFGDYKLGDFGIARKLESAAGSLSRKGTPNYIAPEIERGSRYDATVDLYSLGLVLYRFMNKNRLPFLNPELPLPNPNERTAAIRRRLSGEPIPTPCDASTEMAQVIMCACEYEPQKRFANAAAMKNALLNVSKNAKPGISSNTVSGTNDFFNSTINVSGSLSTDSTINVNSAPLAQPVINKPVSLDSTINAVSPQIVSNAGEGVQYNAQPIATFGTKKKNNKKLIAIAAAIVCALIIIPSFTSKSDKKSDLPSPDETSSVSDTVSEASQFGDDVIELHDVTSGYVLKQERVTETSNEDYMLGDEIWSSAFLYRAGNGDPMAYTEYLLDGKFEKLEFRATPYLGNEVFFENTKVNILVIDVDTDKVLYNKTIDSKAVVTEVSADITGINRISLAVTLESGGNGFANLGYTFIKDAYLYPADSDKKSDSDSSKAEEAPSSQFGDDVIELHDMPNGYVLKQERVTDISDKDYILGDEIWKSAFLYRAGNGDPTAYTEYLLDGKFEKLEFRATPYLGSEDFFENTKVKILVTDTETDKVLYNKTIGSEAVVTEVSVDVTGINRMSVAVTLESGGNGFANLGYTFIKNAYLYPVGYKK